jgi:hypothetical protein
MFFAHGFSYMSGSSSHGSAKIEMLVTKIAPKEISKCRKRFSQAVAMDVISFKLPPNCLGARLVGPTAGPAGKVAPVMPGSA